MKIIQQRSKCIGCGSCAALCGDLFEIADDGLATLKGAKQVGENFELEVQDAGCAKDAADICPPQIIKIE